VVAIESLGELVMENSRVDVSIAGVFGSAIGILVPETGSFHMSGSDVQCTAASPRIDLTSCAQISVDPRRIEMPPA
jgi:hypothetical protein